jgi:hypothetical protein
MFGGPDATTTGSRFKAEILVGLAENGLHHGQDSPQRRHLDQSQSKIYHE